MSSNRFNNRILSQTATLATAPQEPNIDLLPPEVGDHYLASVRFGFETTASDKSTPRDLMSKGLESGNLIWHGMGHFGAGDYPILPQLFYLAGSNTALRMTGATSVNYGEDDAQYIDAGSYLEFAPEIGEFPSPDNVGCRVELIEVPYDPTRTGDSYLDQQKLLLNFAQNRVSEALAAASQNWFCSAQLSIQEVAMAKTVPVKAARVKLADLTGAWHPGIGWCEYKDDAEDDCDESGFVNEVVWRDYYTGARRELKAEGDEAVSVKITVTGTSAIDAMLRTESQELGAVTHVGDLESMQAGLVELSFALRTEIDALAKYFLPPG
jgi:hypothetical protein